MVSARNVSTIFQSLRSARRCFSTEAAWKATNIRSSLRTMAKATLIGRLGREPEIHTFENGQRSLQMSVATNVSERVNDAYEDRAQWHRVYVREGVRGFDYISELPTGTLLYIEGAMRVMTRETMEGRSQFTNITVSPWEGTIRVIDRRANNDEADEEGGEEVDPF